MIKSCGGPDIVRTLETPAIILPCLALHNYSEYSKYTLFGNSKKCHRRYTYLSVCILTNHSHGRLNRSCNLTHYIYEDKVSKKPIFIAHQKAVSGRNWGTSLGRVSCILGTRRPYCTPPSPMAREY